MGINEPLSLAILISGNGSNLQAISDAIDAGQLNARIKLVISDQKNAYGLQRAKNANIDTMVLVKQKAQTRQQYDQVLLDLLAPVKLNLIVLAGFMRILSSLFIRHYPNQIINIHPSLLPEYKGLNTHQRVLDAGETFHGATVHYVTEQLDAGKIILQSRIRVQPQDNEESLQHRVHQEEYIIYPRAIAWLAQKIKLRSAHGCQHLVE